AMDTRNHAELSHMGPPGEEHRLGLLRDFAPDAGRRDVPDPYYGDAGGFDLVLDLIEKAAQGLLADIRENHL
ncbi:MAG: low molecular weight phosphotyrosine protein phosphatase, partial [Rhodospirillales bacterium]